MIRSGIPFRAMATNVPNVKLNNGVSVPAIGLGTFLGLPMTDEKLAKAKPWYITALKAGYRHIDTAQIYLTEKTVGEAIKESGVPREEIFLTTKLPWNHHGREGGVAKWFEDSLKNLGVDYVDLYLIHWPQFIPYEEGNILPRNPDGTVQTTESSNFNEAWTEMEKILASGKAKAIGVSNFSIKTLEQLFKTAKVTPAVNQVELHPYLAQPELVEYCNKKGIVLTAYGAIGYVHDDPLILSLAEKYSVSPAQVILAWHIARGIVVVVKSADPVRQKENLTLPTLDAEDIKKISALDRGERLRSKADEKGYLWGWTYEQLGW